MFVSILSYTYMDGSKSLYNIYFVPLETCNIKLIIESVVDLDWKVFSFSLEKTGHCLCVAFLISRGKTKRRKKKRATRRFERPTRIFSFPRENLEVFRNNRRQDSRSLANSCIYLFCCFWLLTVQGGGNKKRVKPRIEQVK